VHAYELASDDERQKFRMKMHIRQSQARGAFERIAPEDRSALRSKLKSLFASAH
jgi:hypothetical protein